jgi:oligopeptide transport system substrate-binding protein
MLYDVKGARAFHQGDNSDPGTVGVRALDDITLSVELDEPTGHFLHLMAHFVTHPLPQHVVEDHGKEWTDVDKIVTNGSFRLESWHRGESIVLTRNPEYHGRFRGNLQSVKLYIVKNLADHLIEFEMYKADNLDILGIFAAIPQEIERARQRHAGDFLSCPIQCTYYLGFNVLKAPFNDSRVRKAFVLATDRVALINKKLGYYSVASGGYLPPGIPGHSAGIALPYDPDGARGLLAEAGYPGGRGFPDVHCLAPDVVDIIKDFLLAQWRDNLGVEIAWETMEWTEYLERIESAEIPEICWHPWEADYPDPDNFLRVGLKQRPENWQTEDFKILLERARRIPDQKERMKLYKQADKILVEDAQIMPLSYGRSINFVKPWVCKYPTNESYLVQWKDVILEPH